MNSLERHCIALDLKEPDRVPLAPSFLTRTAKLAGVRQYDYHTNPEVLASAQIAHCDHYDFDGVYISSDNVIMYEALGGKIFFPDENSYPFWTDPILTGSHDLSKLSIPDPTRDGRMPLVIEAARIAVERVGARRFVLANIDTGPFSLACTLMGIDNAMAYLVEKPEEMKTIFDFCSEVAIAYGIGMAKSGCHGIQFGEATASLIGRRRYEELVWQYDCKVIRELKKLGVYVFLHVCGNSTPIFDLMVESGADCLEFDSLVDIAWAKEKAGRKVALKGNINTTYFIMMSPDEMMAECKRIITAAKEGGGFILCGGCEVPADTPHEILQVLRRSVDEFGRY
ncbi:MAG: uroporphyrinogen decarboxylase family protein [Chloroflexota bacterium]